MEFGVTLGFCEGVDGCEKFVRGFRRWRKNGEQGDERVGAAPDPLVEGDVRRRPDVCEFLAVSTSTYDLETFFHLRIVLGLKNFDSSVGLKWWIHEEEIGCLCHPNSRRISFHRIVLEKFYPSVGQNGGFTKKNCLIHPISRRVCIFVRILLCRQAF